jgi:hypothetical protein
VSLSVAIHEAGHAVIARKLGLSCGRVTIEPEDRMRAERDGNGKLRLVPDGRIIAHAQIARRWYPRKTATQQECDEAYAVALYAGVEATRVICGKARLNDGRHDDEDAAAVIGDDPALEAELRARANALVREHRALIEQVATALLERRTLYGAEVHVMLGMDA